MRVPKRPLPFRDEVFLIPVRIDLLSDKSQNWVRNIAPSFSLRLGHRTALVLLTPFTTVLPLRYLWEARQTEQIPVRVTKKRDRHHKRVSVSFFVLRTKPNPLARKDACRFAGILFVQGVRIPRVQGTMRYCGSAEIYVEISTDLETIS